MALTPVVYRPIPPVKPVSREPDEDGAPKVDRRKRSKRARKPDPGTGEHLDLWV